MPNGPSMGIIMKLAIISDIHGNLPALDAVLNDLPTIDSIICSGDIVGYYPDVNEVCARLREIEAFVIRGNHDGYVIGELDPGKTLVYRTNWTRLHLADTHLRWLSSLPIEMRFCRDDLFLTVRHASPWDEETYLYKDSPQLAEVSLEGNEMLVLGHTHHPMSVLQEGKGMLVNPGSVGQPRDWNPLSSYIILDTATKGIKVRRVAYDVCAFQERLQSLNWDKAAIEILHRRREIS